MSRALISILLILFPFAPTFAQEGEKVARSDYEIGLYTGTLILSKIPEVIDNIPPIVLKLGMNSALGLIEVSLLHARGNDMRWRSGMIDYRFDLDDLQIPFHALFGFQADMYQKYDGEQEFFGGGWHYGGGAHIEVVPQLFLRADFVNRFGPGRTLLVLIGLSVGIGGEGSQ